MRAGFTSSIDVRAAFLAFGSGIVVSFITVWKSNDQFAGSR